VRNENWIAATRLHENDREWRLDEWNRGRSHRLLGWHGQPRFRASTREEADREAELARWNGKALLPPLPPLINLRRD
jgi:hypothetical protein